MRQQALDGCPLVAFVGTTDPARAKAFYQDTLGLELRSEDAFALVFDVNGTTLRVAIVAKVAAAAYTALGWVVPDIDTAARDLHAAGITFERYAGMPQDDRGVWQAPNGARVAWFKDPDGNTLSITQH
jgi:catechol 2,3-dioxygenase-like lactoylglutathione lyase family enzyme